MDMYRSVVRPLLFRVSADRAHDLGHLGLRVTWPWRVLGYSSRFSDDRLKTEVAGIKLNNPIGLAPGFDKDGQLVSSLDQLGFGYLVVGSITKHPRRGNARPRMVRYPETLSIANSLGLPSVGLSEALRLLRSARVERSQLMASVAGFSSAELLESATAVAPHVAAVEIGLICPNTTNAERMEEISIFTELIEGLAKNKKKPVFIKLPPPHTDIEREQVHRMLDAILRVGIDGVSVSGGRTVEEPQLRMGRGSLNGQATYADALRNVRDVSAYTKGAIAIKGSGGVFHGAHAAEMLRAGASTIEVYTSFIFRGWKTAGMLKRELLDVMENEAIDHVADLSHTADAAGGEPDPA